MTIRLVAFIAALPAAAAAQVGHLPTQSPFRDVDMTSRVTTFAGWYSGARDEAGVLPRSGPLFGVRWDVHVGGPGDLMFRVAHVSTQRDVIDPAKSQGQRIVERRDVSLSFADVGLSFNVSGNKTWHGVMPILHGTVGVVSDFAGRDSGGFSHGTTFAIGYGAGLRYVPPGGRVSVRADVGSYYYSTEYPATYYGLAADSTRVLSPATPRSQWRNNWTMLFGITYVLFR